MPDTPIDDVPADDSEAARELSRREFGKLTFGVLAVAGGVGMAAAADLAANNAAAAEVDAARRILGLWEPRSLSGHGNNVAHPEWGTANTIYPRVAPAAYIDGIHQPPTGPNARWISNRIFNDTGVLIYSARNISTWGFVWGQFVDHTIALRRGRRQTGEDGELANIPTDPADPIEEFRNDLDVVFVNRSIPADGTGETTPRDQTNQLSSYLDAVTVYGEEEGRLNWMREGPADGDMSKSGARLLLRDGYLPRRNHRGNPDTAPSMVFGAMPDPAQAIVAGDQRANENPMLSATQTLFAREHNRIVSLLPADMPAEDKFQIARAVVIAEQQYITYHEYLPSLGVRLPRYTGYKPSVDTGVTNEFATVGYRAHSMISPQLELETEAARYSAETIDWLRSLGVKFTVQGDKVKIIAPHGYATFFQPDLIERLQLGPVLQGIGLTPMCENNELIINRIRSLVAPVTETTQAVNDLAAVDVERGRDHGLPYYNDLRRAYGLAPRTSFREITGEDSEEFPADPLLTPGDEINDLRSLDFIELYDLNGRPTTAAANNATRGVRRTPLAARLKAVYGGDLEKIDAFVGMVCEAHVAGTEFGELQLAIWRRQFAALRDGDRFFYEHNPLLRFIRRTFGIDYRTTLGDLIARNTDIPRRQLARNVFFARRGQGPVDDYGDDAADATPAGAAPAAAPAAEVSDAAPAVAVAAAAVLGAAASTAAGPGGSAAAPAADPLDRKPWYCGRAEI